MMVMEVNENKTRELTPMQKMAFEYYAKDKFRSKARAIRKAGYSEAVARQPHKVFGSPAVKKELFFLGYSDKIGKHQKEHGKTIEEWKEETVEEKENRENIDEVIRQITPEQINLIRDRLIEAGYNPYAKTPIQEKETSSYIPEGTGADIFSFEGGMKASNKRDFDSLSSM
jgi:hypothetical protein